MLIQKRKKRYRYQRQTFRQTHAKSYLDSALQMMPVGVIVVSQYGRVRLLNPTAATIFKVTPEAARKRPLLQVVRNHRFTELFARCRQSNLKESAILEVNESRFLQITVTPFLHHEDQGFVVLIQELTQSHQLQTVSEDMISNFAHELRTPISTLRALVDTLIDGAIADPTAAQRFLHYMATEVDVVTRMVQDLLDLTRLEAAKDPLQVTALSVASLLWRSVERVRLQAEFAQVTLHLVTPPNLPPVYIDGERVQQVLINIIQNAIKFTKPGGEIEVAATATDGPMVLIKVTDNGIGIASEDLPLLFERFYKSNRPRSGSGIGLGLAMAKHIVQAHGGQIWAESAGAQGATFFFTLPTTNVTAALSTPDSPAALPIMPSHGPL